MYCNFTANEVKKDGFNPSSHKITQYILENLTLYLHRSVILE